MRTYTQRIAVAILACLTSLSITNAHAAPGCLSPGAWTTLEREPFHTVASANVMDDMAKRDVVLLGEYHDDADHHRWQLQTLSELYFLHPNMAIGFEMFPRRLQPVLDRWVAGELTVKQFLEQTDWKNIWNTPPELYLPLFQFARINRIPMVALNVDNTLSKAIRDKGWDAVPEAQREGVGKAAAPPDAYRDFLFDVYRMHTGQHGAKDQKTPKSDVAFQNFVDSQTTWDRAMAEALAQRLRTPPGGERPLVVGIIGAGHVRFGYGVAHQLRDLGVKNIGSLLAVPYDAECKNIRSGLASAVFALPPHALEKPEPPRLGVRLEEKDGAVRISDVSAGSLAEKSGLKPGDRLLEVGSQPVTSAPQVSASVRNQPAGTWLPMRVQRGDETLEMVVKFPVTR